ncbi:MAG: hypothetical protein ACQEVA_09180 [Myxococcota bacterium]
MRTTQPTLAPLIAGLLAITLFFSGSTVLAQDGSSGSTEINEEGFAEPSEAQLEMNEKGVGAIVDGDFDKAARLFQASIDLGKLNITYLNLGRALQKARRCRDAKRAYLNVKKDSTPKVQNPPPFEISSRAEQYLAELERKCPGEVKVTCKPDDLAEDVQLFINTRGPKTCGADPFDVSPGEVVVKGVLGEQTLEEVVTVDPVELASVTLEFERPPEPEPEEKEPVAEKDESGEEEREPADDVETAQGEDEQLAQKGEDPEASEPTEDTAATERPPPTTSEVSLEQPAQVEDDKSSGGGWWIAAGMGLVGGGLYFDVIADTASNGELDEVDFIPPSTYLLGGIAIIYGLTNL